MFGWTLIKSFGGEGSIKSLLVIFHNMRIDMDSLKKEDGVMIRNLSEEYKHKSIPISNQRYKYGVVMEKSVLDITDILRHQKQVLTTSDISNIEGNFVLKLRGLKIENH